MTVYSQERDINDASTFQTFACVTCKVLLDGASHIAESMEEGEREENNSEQDLIYHQPEMYYISLIGTLNGLSLR